MANHYHDFYLGNYTDLELEKASSQKERLQICEKRLSEGWMLYSLLEIKQRYQIPGINIVQGDPKKMPHFPQKVVGLAYK